LRQKPKQTPGQTRRARRLRRRSTGPERKLWSALRGGRVHGFRFRRQHPVGPYTTDFVCLPARLIVEVDGRQHDLDDPAERRRTAYLERQGFTVLRVANEDVLQNLDGVLTAIETALPDPRYRE